MEKKQNWEEYQKVLSKHNITKLYHFTDRENIESIVCYGGLYSWADCEDKGIKIAKPGGGQLSRDLDRRSNLQYYVRTSFVKEHPMKYVAMNDGRITNPVVLEIDPEVALWSETRYADRNAASNGANVGGGVADLKAIHFDAVKARTQFDLDDAERPFFQAEVLVKNFIPLKYITNLPNFVNITNSTNFANLSNFIKLTNIGIAMPSQSSQIAQVKQAYTAQITRKTPTAFIFLIDQSVSMRGYTELFGESMPKAAAVARIVNSHLNELVNRCVKGSETRDYYDIAVIGYGENVYSGWKGDLAGRDFVKPSELQAHPYREITVRKEVRTRREKVVKEVKEIQWLEPDATGSWTHVHKAFRKAKELLDGWMEQHHEQDCYPPTIINITDGMFNGASTDYVMQQANELKSMFTNDGNVILFNIHISSESNPKQVTCPPVRSEVEDDKLAATLYDISSLLPERYSADIAKERGDDPAYQRYTAMAANVGMDLLIRLLDIGTPTNITQSANKDNDND